MRNDGLLRYAGPVSAGGVYGRPTIPVPTRRLVAMIAAVLGILALAYVTGAFDAGGVMFAGGFIVTERSRTMREKRGQLITQARAILDAAPDGVIPKGSEDEQRYDKLYDEAESLGKAIEREERQAEADRSVSTPPDTARMEPVPGAGADEGRSGEPVEFRNTPEYRDMFKRYLRGGERALHGEEKRALQADSDTGGGYLVAPQQFVATLIKAVDDVVHLRQRATKYPVTSAASLGFPSLATDPDDFDWTTELGTGSEDSAMSFGKREFKPNPLAKRIKISNRLLRVSAIDPEGLVISRLAYKLAVTQEKAYLTGNGAGRPLGVFVASNDGIPSSRDVTASAQTAFTADDLQDVKYALKPQYRMAASWLLHRDAVKRAAKLKDGNGQYLLQPGLSADIPDRILGLPFMESEFAPNTFTAGLYVGLLGDFSHYWIADALDMQVQRLVELYAESNQAGFIARYEGDGMPVMGEAFSRLKLGS